MMPRFKLLTNQLNMKTTTVITTSASTIATLSASELTRHTTAAAAEFAAYHERGCKYLGLLRGRLQMLGMTSGDAFHVVRHALVAAGMEEKKAKSTANNGGGFAAMAHLVLREDGGVCITEERFYAVPTKLARQVAKVLKTGDDAVRAFNRLRLKNGKLSGLEAFLPSEEAEAEAEEAESTEAEESAEETPKETPRQAVARAIATLTKLLPSLNDKDKDAALSALAALIG
jgi:hypothetical protein